MIEFISTGLVSKPAGDDSEVQETNIFHVYSGHVAKSHLIIRRSFRGHGGQSDAGKKTEKAYMQRDERLIGTKDTDENLHGKNF